MEANLFRCLAHELARELSGVRVDKIYNPAPDVWTFKVRAAGGASFLLLRCDQRNGLVFLTSEKPANPANPSARCMWLRKRLVNRRLFEARVDWPGRALAFSLAPEEGGPWLVLSPVAAPRLEDDLPAGFGDEPEWPEAAAALADEEVWRRYPQLTPPLRRLLAAMDEGRREAVLGAVSRGGCSQFYLYGGGSPQLLAWRLPGSLRGQRDEEVFDDVLAAADALGRSELFPYLTRLAEADEQGALKAELRRVKRSLASVERDRERLEGLMEKGRQGEAIRAMLYNLDKNAKLDAVDVPGPDGEPERVDLDARLTVAANMERFFKLAAKGRRGLGFVRTRREELEARLAELQQGRLPAEVVERLQEGETRNRVRKVTAQLPKGLAAFRTDDGFTAYRGKSAQANHDLVRKVASPFDLWFHARGGAGSHVVLRLDYPEQEVPEQSLMQAAALAGLRSFATGNARVDVICARVRHVHAVKGAGPGKVTVDQEFAALTVDLDPALEQRLSTDP